MNIRKALRWFFIDMPEGRKCDHTPRFDEHQHRFRCTKCTDIVPFAQVVDWAKKHDPSLHYELVHDSEI